MKKVLLGILLLVVVVIGGGLWFVYSNLDALVARGIENAGTSAAGTAARVDSVDVDLFGGSATVRGFTLANPEGFSDAAMLTFEELNIVIDLPRLNGNNISIVSITGRNPHLLYETRGGESNLDVVRERMASRTPAPEAQGPTPNLEIGSIVIEGVGATISSDLMPSDAVVDLGDIRLQNLSGTPNEIAKQVLEPLLSQLALNVGRIALTLLPEDVRAAGAAVRDAAKAGIEQVGGRIGGLLRGGTDEETEGEASAGDTEN